MCLLSIGGKGIGNFSQGCIPWWEGREIWFVLCLVEDSSCGTINGELKLFLEGFSECICVVAPNSESSSEIAREVYHMPWWCIMKNLIYQSYRQEGLVGVYIKIENSIKEKYLKLQG